LESPEPKKRVKDFVASVMNKTETVGLTKKQRNKLNQKNNNF
jgi:hypothetical protein